MNAIEFLRSQGGFYALVEIVNGVEPCPDILATLNKATKAGKLDHRTYDGRDQWRIHSTKPIGPRGKTDKWTRESIIAAIQAYGATHGRAPAFAEFRTSNGLPSTTALYKLFRSIPIAVAEAGLEPRKVGRS